MPFGVEPRCATNSGFQVFLRFVDGGSLVGGSEPRTQSLLNRFCTHHRSRPPSIPRSTDNFPNVLVAIVMLNGSRLIGDFRLQINQVWHHDSVNGTAILIPLNGVLLVVTDEHPCETCFGFFLYPALLSSQSGKFIMPAPSGSGWYFRDAIKTPDPRHRALVADFRDEFEPSQRR